VNISGMDTAALLGRIIIIYLNKVKSMPEQHSTYLHSVLEIWGSVSKKSRLKTQPALDEPMTMHH